MKILRILAVVLVLVFLVTQTQSLSGILTIAAVLLWTATAAVVLQVAGFARDGMVGSVAASATRLLAPGTRSQAASARASAATAAGAPASPQRQTKIIDLPADRGNALARGQSQLTAMIGEDPARKEILEKMVPQARAFSEKKKPLLGAARALVVLIAGPHGVGKSVVARALVDLLYGLDVVQKPLLSEVPAPTGSRLAPEWAATLEEGFDGVTLVDNASWLLQTHPLTGSLHADGFFEAVTQVANANPGKLALIVTLTDKQLAEIHRRAAFKDLVRKLTQRQLVMSPIEPQDMVRVLRAQLKQHGLKCADTMSEPLRRLVKRYSDADSFDNAEAMRRVTESLLEANPATDGREVTLEELERAFEYKV